MEWKKVFVKISLALAGLAAVMFSGCGLSRCEANCNGPMASSKTEEGFIYYLENKNGGIASGYQKASGAVILGYAKAGEIDELVIPEKLGGVTVTGIGESWSVMITAPVHEYGIDCEDINKVVINHDLWLSYYGLQNFEGTLVLNSKTNIDRKYINENYVEINVDPSQIKIEGESYLDYLSRYEKYENEYTGPNKQYLKAVSFDATGGTQKTYAVMANGDGLIKEPEAPVRERYAFGGWWYVVEDDEDVTKNYEVQWNFEEDTVPYKDRQGVALFAKWIAE